MPSIKVYFNQEELDRLEKGPLAATGGRGKSPWMHLIAIRELERFEGVGDGSVQARELATAMQEGRA